MRGEGDLSPEFPLATCLRHHIRNQPLTPCPHPRPTKSSSLVMTKLQLILGLVHRWRHQQFVRIYRQIVPSNTLERIILLLTYIVKILSSYIISIQSHSHPHHIPKDTETKTRNKIIEFHPRRENRGIIFIVRFGNWIFSYFPNAIPLLCCVRVWRYQQTILW